MNWFKDNSAKFLFFCKKHSLVSHVILMLGLVQAIFPFLWMIVMSFMSYQETISLHFTLPKQFNFDNYQKVIEILNVPKLLLNSILMTSGVVFTQLILCSMAGYAFARIKFPYKKTIFMVLMSVLMVPGNVFLIPQYLVMIKLKLVNTILGLILPGSFSIFGTFLMRQSFMQVDKSIEEAAILDGCGHFRIYWNIMLPLIKPGIVTLGLIDGIWAWNNLVWPLILNSDPNKMTLTSQLAIFSGRFNTEYQELMAAATITVLPIIIIYFLLQKKFISSVTLTANK